MGLEKGSKDFDGFINKCNLIDLPLIGKEFTWYGLENKRSWLDRFLLKDIWLVKIKDFQLLGLRRFTLNHISILLTSKSVDWEPRPLKFINAWFKRKDCVALIEKEWADMNCLNGKIVVKLRKLKGVLKIWRVRNFIWFICFLSAGSLKDFGRRFLIGGKLSGIW